MTRTTTPSDAPSRTTNRTLLRFLFALAWRYKRGCARILLLQIALLTLGLFGLGLMGTGVDFIRFKMPLAAGAAPAKPPIWPLGLTPPAAWLQDHPMSLLSALAIALLVMAAGRGWLNYSYSVESCRLVQAQIVVDLRSRVFAKMQRLSFRFFDAHASASIINRVTGDVQSVRLFIDGVIIPCVVLALSLGVYIAYMLRISPALSLACLSVSPLLWYVSRAFVRALRPRYLVLRERADRLVLVLTEFLNGVAVVKGFGIENQQIGRFDEANDAIFEDQRTVFTRISQFHPLVTLISQLSVVVLLGYGGWLVVRYEQAPDAATAVAAGLSIGQLIIFSGLLQQFSGQVANIANIANSIQQSLIAAQRVYEVLTAPVEIENADAALPLDRPRGAVAFSHVTFGYNPARPVLRDVSFSAEPGEAIAILGATGSGKSTLLSLIPRFYDATSGRVLIDGHDVRDLDIASLRRAIGVVFQESFLFSTSITNNIAFGHPEADRAAVERAARIAGAHDFILQMPAAYDTVLHEGGADLSGGQRQRLAIARAILNDPVLLLLDDPMAAIDPQTEHEILDAMDGAMRGRTTFIVAHRLSTLRRANRIIVLDEGVIAETGTHDELLARGGLYHAIVRLQLSDTEPRP